MPEETSLYFPLGAQDQRLGVEQDQLLCGSTGTSSGNCRETETCMLRACHTSRQPLQIIFQGTLKGGQLPWLAEEVLDGQYERVDIPAHARTAHNSLLQKSLEEDLLLNRPSSSPNDPISQGTELNIFARLGVKSHGLAAWHRVKITITRSICLTMGLT